MPSKNLEKEIKNKWNRKEQMREGNRRETYKSLFLFDTKFTSF
jgi:hypothetical protein